MQAGDSWQNFRLSPDRLGPIYRRDRVSVPLFFVQCEKTAAVSTLTSLGELRKYHVVEPNREERLFEVVCQAGPESFRDDDAGLVTGVGAG